MAPKGTSRPAQDRLRRQARLGWRRLRQHGPGQMQFWLIALVIGILAGFAALLFRAGIDALQTALYGADDRAILDAAAALPWYLLVLFPALGGLVVGVILHRFTPDGRAHAVADVIEGAALRRGRVEVRAGLASAAASLLTLGSGGSAGREGPVVHLAGVISTLIAERIRASGITGRDLLGCAVAAAVSASFNAPIAGAIFAMEVVLRHYALHAFAPIAIASVAGTVINRLHYGDVAEFTLPLAGGVAFYWEIPAFLLLGLVAGAVAVVMMRAIFLTEDLANRLQARSGLPRWLRPALAGALVGVLAIWFPQVIGIGYEVTSLALTGKLFLHEAIVFAALKVTAVAITLGGRMGGGVFSPALVVGALTGLAFGLIATSVVPQFSGAATVYALAGMGAVAAAVLGAPISTTLIVFEMTGDWETAVAVLAAVSTATALASRFVQRSFFLTQLARRGVRIAHGPQEYLADQLPILRAVRRADSPQGLPAAQLAALAAQGHVIDADARLKAALRQFERDGSSHLAVRRRNPEGGEELIGSLAHLDALRSFNRALASTAAEEHS